MDAKGINRAKTKGMLARTITQRSESEIGGYFELDLADYGDPFPRPYLKFQSARAALRALLTGSRFRECWVPAYVCNSVLESIQAAGCTPRYYFLDYALRPVVSERIPEYAALIYINYFGLSNPPLSELLLKLTLDQLIIDNTQALFADDHCAFGAIYSPRKFAGLPDGGLLRTRSAHVQAPAVEDTHSMARMVPLLMRMSGSAREGYQAFLEANRQLEDSTPLAMSRLSRRILRSIDMAQLRARRRANFMRLAAAFNRVNRVYWHMEETTVPLCYPLLLDRRVTCIRKSLAQHDVFVPTYWEEARERVAGHEAEEWLLDHCLALPCDQRYSDRQMDHLIDVVRRVLQGP
ncbi:hypothetical protein [Castellaniella sp.]|uniref:hypothetical protein n=1 Tax=Castellaniella sp. TaxID=1955812 RepID=UPI003561617E